MKAVDEEKLKAIFVNSINKIIENKDSFIGKMLENIDKALNSRTENSELLKINLRLE